MEQNTQFIFQSRPDSYVSLGSSSSSGDSSPGNVSLTIDTHASHGIASVLMVLRNVRLVTIQLHSFDQVHREVSRVASVSSARSYTCHVMLNSNLTISASSSDFAVCDGVR